MVRFSCFSLPIRNCSSKKSAQHHSAQIFPGKMQKEVPGRPQDSGTNESPSSACSNWNADGILSTSTPEQMETPAFECGQLEEFNTISCVEEDKEIHLTNRLKKSQSLGSGLDKGGFSCSTDLEGELDGRFLFCNSNEKGYDRVVDSFNNCGDMDSFDHHDIEIKYCDQNQVVHSFDENLDHVHNASIFSIGDSKPIDQELQQELQGDSCELYSAGHADLGNFAHMEPPISKSRSLPSLCGPNNLHFLSYEFPGRSRSFEDLCTRDMRDQYTQGLKILQNGISQQPGALLDCHHMDLSSNLAENKAEEYISFKLHCCSVEMPDQGDAVIGHEINRPDFRFSDEYGSSNLNDMGDDSRVPQMHEIEIRDVCKDDYPSPKWDELTGEELNMRRVKDWLSQIDINDKCPSEEIIQVKSSVSVAKMKDIVHSTTTFKLDTRGNPGMEAAYNYISSLTAVSTSAQMAGLGLVVIPFLSAFTSLRLLNLSGNSIVRITAGALPRGLHMLNLSRNSISTIEGLREITRLRVLDLSYNRILRIGHGLSACSSMKELYLAGNKISEVEGLHRLLKLSILDLRYNKISTTKCLGQLAANYGSLQAINLDGNPAQRNVGDEQLRKYVISLLPHLVYFNKHVIKASSSKEVSDRSSRSSASHQFDRNLRSEHKRARRGHVGSTSHKPFTLSNHGRSTQATSSLVKQSRSSHAPLPPSGSKPGHHPPIVDPKLLGLKLSNPIRRSRSEGNLG